MAEKISPCHYLPKESLYYESNLSRIKLCDFACHYNIVEHFFLEYTKSSVYHPLKDTKLNMFDSQSRNETK